jgi:hypothetical protein
MSRLGHLLRLYSVGDKISVTGNIRRKICPRATLSTTNSTWSILRLNTGLWGEKPATNHINHLTHSTAFLHSSYKCTSCPRIDPIHIHTHTHTHKTCFCVHLRNFCRYVTPDKITAGFVFNVILFVMCLWSRNVSNVKETGVCDVADLVISCGAPSVHMSMNWMLRRSWMLTDGCFTTAQSRLISGSFS